jgi:hypothetical protein
VWQHWLWWSVIVICLLVIYSLLVLDPYRDKVISNFAESFGLFSFLFGFMFELFLACDDWSC